MCGVVGLIAPGAVALPDDLDRMSDAVAHRGPDDAGCWLDAEVGVALAHRRLAIVDLSPSGHQPMVSADGRWVLVFNGEVYDHVEHRRRRWRRQGRPVPRSLRHRGDCSSSSPGWGLRRAVASGRRDVRPGRCGTDSERVLVLARDRLGEKPLYYGRVGAGFVFASELGAIRRLPQCPTEPDPQALADYLRFGFVPSPLSILPGIHKVPAGSVLRVSANGEPGSPVPYWSLVDVARAGRAAPLSAGDDEPLTSRTRPFAARWSDASRPTCRSAPSCPGAWTRRRSSPWPRKSVAPVRTFTVAVGGSGTRRRTPQRWPPPRHRPHHPSPPGHGRRGPGGACSTIYDEPFADPSAVPTALLCAVARRT